MGATTVANYESGERMPDLVTAYMIAMHYHTGMDFGKHIRGVSWNGT